MKLSLEIFFHSNGNFRRNYLLFQNYCLLLASFLLLVTSLPISRGDSAGHIMPEKGLAFGKCAVRLGTRTPIVFVLFNIQFVNPGIIL